MSSKPFRLAVRAVIHDDHDRYLLLRRSGACKAFVGTWEWPGGKTDPGETFDVAVLREVREETGLEIELTGVAGAFHFEMAQQHIATLCLESKPTGGTLRLSDEHDRADWTPLADLLKWSLTPGFREFAEEYVKQLTQKGPSS